ncbi:glycolate permease glcA, partial [Escherichia coli]|nr:glycolate permease glcA [Escherichia coli]EFN6096773.1 glycolate permease glcA [Escherichia coli]
CIHLNLMIFTKIIRGFISTQIHFVFLQQQNTLWLLFNH